MFYLSELSIIITLRVCLTGDDRSNDEHLFHTNTTIFLYLLNELPNWSVSGHICMRKGVHRSNDHRR